ncbi:MAG: hypothetical protein K6U04_01580 [Armatimonadetes bacterium]|nr:hypothetical protein [Armatimonadota bacterium]
MGYTPGPWEAVRIVWPSLNESYCVESKAVKRPNTICTIYPVREQEANAYLIAAAPELNEALKELVDNLKNNEVIKSHLKYLGRMNEHILEVVLQKAIRAIAKAEGKQKEQR